jgi:hypothetical protein
MKTVKLELSIQEVQDIVNVLKAVQIMTGLNKDLDPVIKEEKRIKYDLLIMALETGS